MSRETLQLPEMTDPPLSGHSLLDSATRRETLHNFVGSHLIFPLADR